ncbi:MAG: hypothetical protein O2960_25130, partial [Verrucomicrobia bacterium]|nr:hypothetical protein [Verrucomicrobiota bacterium]
PETSMKSGLSVNSSLISLWKIRFSIDGNTVGKELVRTKPTSWWAGPTVDGRAPDIDDVVYEVLPGRHVVVIEYGGPHDGRVIQTYPVSVKFEALAGRDYEIKYDFDGGLFKPTRTYRAMILDKSTKEVIAESQR